MNPFSGEEIKLLSDCRLCPRECGANRFAGPLGFCRSNAGFQISGICIHKGEEPVISGKKGICNVFFPHCNLQCIFCQNHEISRNGASSQYTEWEYDALVGQICTLLDQTENILGFVSPSHYIPQMLALIRGVRKRCKNPVVVYNSNGYDKVEALRMLEGIVDVYLPDFKYIDTGLAFDYSGARNYPEVALLALKEMYRQKGATLVINDDGIAESGIIVRHLVLPNAAAQSISVLQHLSRELSLKLHISLMAQYFPTDRVREHPQLGRTITKAEYTTVVQAFHELGFYRGWIQDLSSQAAYRPDFKKDEPFGQNELK